MPFHTLIRPLVAAVLTTIALAVAACGEEAGAGGSGGSGGKSDREDARNAALEFAQCMREHGVDMPDPQFDGRGIMQRGPDEDTPRATLEKAENACKEIREAMEPSEPPSEEQQKEMKEAALAHARCMREHGIENFPDPTFDADGGMQIRIGKGTGIDPDDEDFQKAQEACEGEMPQLRSEEPGQ
jgi:hypothetical protein